MNAANAIVADRTTRMSRLGLLHEPAGYVDGANLYEFVRGNPTGLLDPMGTQAETTQPTTEPTTQPVQDDNLNSDSAFQHYKSGSGTPKWMPFSKIDTSSVKPSDFPQVKAEIGAGPGDREVDIDSKMPFTTSGDQQLFLGDITLRLQGEFSVTGDCWTFAGTLKSYDDVYDFNASTHRSFLGEALTALGRNTAGKAFDINIRGAKDTSQTGTFSGGAPATQTGGGYNY